MAADGPLTAADVDLLHQSLRESEKRVALLRDVIEALSQSRDALSLLQRTVESVVRAIAASGAFVYLWDDDAGQFVMRAATEGHQKAFVGRIALRPGEGLTGWSALMRRPVLIGENLADDPRIVNFPELLETDFQSCLIVPILVPGGDPVGVFSIYSVNESAFTDDDLRLVDEVAKLLASGIDRAHVVDLWERQSAALESLIGMADVPPTDARGCLSELVRRLIAIVPSEICIAESTDFDGSTSESTAMAVRRILPASGEDEVGRHLPIPASTARQLAKTASPALQSISLPMRLGDRTVGVLTAFRLTAFSAEDRALLEAIAGYGALALHGLAARSTGDFALGQLVCARSDEEAAIVLCRFGWTPGSWVTPVVIRCDPRLTLTSARSLDSVTQTVAGVFAGRWRRMLTSAPGIVAGLVMTPGEPVGNDLASTWADREIASALAGKGQAADVAVGVGSPAHAPADIALQFRAAAMACGLVALSSDGVSVAVGNEDELTMKLIGVTRGVAPMVRRYLDSVHRLRDYDGRHNTDLLGTLEVFVRERGSAQRASDRLFIHRNTLRQRLTKISGLIGEPIEAIDDWLPVLLATLIARSTG